MLSQYEPTRGRRGRLLRARWMPLLRIAARLRRYRHWVPVFSFIAGAASFFLVKRRGPMAQWLTVLLLVSWLALLLESLLSNVLRKLTGFGLPYKLTRFATQALHQESFYFVLPFMLATTNWVTGQAVFTGLVGAAALASTVDPVYFDVIAEHRWVFLAYHAFALFVVIQTGLPVLLHLTTGESLGLAALSMCVFSVPSLAALIRVERWWRWGLLIFASIALSASLWSLRAWVPPATLWAAHSRATLTMDTRQLQPGKALHRISAARLKADGLYAFTAIRAPRGLHEAVYHVWMHNGRVVDKIALQIRGGRAQGYRAWSHKESFPPDPAGHWTIAIKTGVGQLIGTIGFDVTGIRSASIHH